MGTGSNSVYNKNMEASTNFYRHLQYADGDIGSIEFAMESRTMPATPSSILFSPQRSPKGPRPAPSTVYALTEPARIPLPDVPDSVFLSTSPSASVLQNNVDPLQHSEYYDNTSASRNDAEVLTTSLLSAASTSPPPFARATQRTASTSSATSSHHSAVAGSVYQASTHREPDPWVSQAQECITKALEDGNPMPEAQAAHSVSISGYGPVRSPSAMAGSELQTPGAGEERGIQESRVIAEEAGRITFSTLFRRSRNLSSNEDKQQQQQQLPVSQHPAPLSAAVPISDLSASTSKSETRPSLPQTSPSAPITISTTAEPQMRSSGSKSPVIGSVESSNINIGESVTWEKVDDFNDEWTQLDNPREEVVAMSESEDSDLEEDDEEWDACRQQAATGMADSIFVPSVQRRRREAGQHQQVDDKTNGNATPKGKRTPTTSFAQNGGMQTGAHASTVSTSTTTVQMPRHLPQNRLTPRQEEIVAEMQRARMARGIGIVPRHTQNTQRIMTVTSDW